MPTVDVLQVVPTLEIGGLERVATHLCMGLRDRYRIGAACLKGEGPFADELRANGVPVFSWGPEAREKPYTAFARLRRLIRQCGARVLHSHNTGPFTDSILATRFLPHVRVVHTDHARNFPDKWRYMTAERLCARAAHRVIAVSEHSKRNLERFERIPGQRIDVIPNGIDQSQVRDLPEPAFDAQRGITIGTAVRFTEQKSLHTLLDAVAIVLERELPIRVRLAGDGPERAALEQQAQRLGIADRVAFLGYQTDVAAVLGALDIYVLSSIWEGMPMGLLEAMAAARPTVTTAVGGVPEVVKDGVTGRLVPPRDPQAMADALSAMVQDTERARAMGREARKLALAEYSLEAMSRRYAAVYDDALEAGAA